MSGVSQTNLELTGAAACEDAPPAQGSYGGAGGVNRGDPIKSYEKELSTAWRWACIMGSLHACSRFVALCNLTWATVVLLGAFVPNLVPTDFTLVVVLLLLDGARLSSASFFTRLLGRALAYLSQDPKSINHSQDDHYTRAEWARISSHFLQLICILPGLFLSGTRFFSKLDDYNAIQDQSRNLQKSLRIFYMSVFANSCAALLSLICSAIATNFCVWGRRRFPREQSIRRYFDKVLENAMAFGVVQADDFEFFHFALRMLATSSSFTLH